MDKSHILTVFRLITPQDLRHLTEALQSRKANLMAAGAELLVWDKELLPKPEAKILDFNKNKSSKKSDETLSLSEIGVLSADEQKERQKSAKEEEDKDKPSESDFLLEEREKFKETEVKMFKQNGYACYQRSSDLSLYRVTVTDDKGKEKSRLPSSQGVLVNKKQA